ncbi:glycosyltransferase family 2 protein [Chryseobacterium sp. CFBP8996]|uniref:glycosyltransferase family 2 protein n=1 Tax=Chryseobacterium sp. CFBP8996 TaxID=3096529 RepID=UPI002A6B6CBC|nr:glycosyltransferase family 2 protein [Chryseobacterium sp. CFBP8996]MDY0933029.1 glycosyltransferase family 2 protein [Chryseobacterium sp. CFBP8996]
MKKISFIIVTYNSLSDINNCINSIYQYSDISLEMFEIIIVDNSSREVFLEMKSVVLENYSDIKFIHNDKNCGYGQGNNVGIKSCESEIICIINPDVILTNKMFSHVIERFRLNPDLALIGGKQSGGINLSFWIRPEYEFFLITTPLMLWLNSLNLYNENYFFLSGALLFVDHKKFEEIGLFDENIFLYREESDIQKRFLKKKYKCHFEKKLTYRHLIDNRSKTSDTSFAEEIKSTKYYMKKYGYNFNFFIFQRLLYLCVMKYFYYCTLQKQKYLDIKKNLKRFTSIKTYQ